MKLHHRRTLFFILLMVLASARAATVDIQSIRSYTSKEHTRVVFDLSDATIYRLFSLVKPDRLVIDIANANAPPQWPKISASGSPIVQVRSSQHGQNVLRVVLDLKSIVKIHSFSLAPDAKHGHRLVVDLKPLNIETSADHKNVLTPSPEVVLSTQVPVTRASNTKPPRDVIVVIDPGHGGKDPGAIGSRHTQEKIVTLNISREIKRLIDQRPGMHAVLTRRGDYYVGLRQRIRLARRDKADLFVAIHADAYRNPHSHGASVYALSARGASSEAARWLAEKENQSELLGGADLADKDHMLRTVLLDLSQTATVSASMQMGESILKHLSQVSNLHHLHVEQAGFVVLKSPDIPSVLIETGFLSNQYEEKQLRNKIYQQRIAHAIVNGIETYLSQHPPPGTRYYKKWQHVS